MSYRAIFFFTSTLLAADPFFDTIKEEDTSSFIQDVCKKSTYFAMGSAFEVLSFASDAMWQFQKCLSDPVISKDEYLLFKELAQQAASKLFIGHSKKVVSPYYSWHLNKELLSKVPTSTEEEKNLVLFLENRWLAKSTGFFPSWVHWICPVFDISLQIHPETSPSYARSPAIFLFKAYQKKADAWKRSLPHPYFFPLVLTRPFDLDHYFPSYFKVESKEDLLKILQQIQKKSSKEKVILDVSSFFSKKTINFNQWIKEWNAFQLDFFKNCQREHVNPKDVICVEKIVAKEANGFRLLLTSSFKQLNADHEFFLQWVSRYGLASNLVELSRVSPFQTIKKAEQKPSENSLSLTSKEDFLFCLDLFWEVEKTFTPEKRVLLEGILFPLKGLLESLSLELWQEAMSSPTKSSIIEFSLSNIEKQLRFLQEKGNDLSFFDTASHAEELHANFSTLLEIFSIFSHKDFALSYQNLLSLPPSLQPLVSSSLHSSGMTSLTGILQATKSLLKRPLHILYGENTYYESILACEGVSKTCSCLKATEEDLKQVDLLIAQFNPVWQGTKSQKHSYHVENVSQNLHKIFKTPRTTPLVLALDCTLDYLFSSKVQGLLKEFEEEILKGNLNVICYRSGLKFDLFGLDSYCGAPLYMLHNQDEKWSPFDLLLQDPALQTDHLSVNWFYLAYRYAAPQLDLYRRYIFDNTRALLKSLSNNILLGSAYQVIPMEDDVDPSFIDITVEAPLHALKVGALVMGSLSLGCMEKNIPIFYRISLGMYHTNITMLTGDSCSTARLTLGLDPNQIEVISPILNRLLSISE